MSIRRLRSTAWLVLAATLLAWQSGRSQAALTFRQSPPAPFAPRNSATDNPASVTLVVYNSKDPVSRELAEFYAQKRSIDPEHVVALNCPLEEEISRDEYDQTIANPLRAVFDARGWWARTADRPEQDPSSHVVSNRIRYVALMRGVPLKIRQADAYPGDAVTQPAPIGGRNGASVDSELAVLGLFTHHISGLLSNPYYRSFERFPDTNHPGMMLVTRLDAPTAQIVRRMIEDSIAVEKTGLWGRCYLDGRGLLAGASLADGDAWIKRIATGITPFAMPTIYDNEPALFSAAYPMTETALYFGWYSEQTGGVLAGEHFQFRPGAVACHIHSYSAASLRDPTHWWVAPLLNKGAAAVLGNVYEPYLTFTTHLDLFAERLCSGMTFAESAYAGTSALSWMDTFVGDPLYRPCAAWKSLEFDLDPPTPVPGPEGALIAENRAYFQGASIWHLRGAAAGAKELEKSALHLKSGRIYEGLGLLQASAHDLPAARRAFQQAARNYTAPADSVRAMLDEAHALADAGEKAAAVQVLEAGRKQFGTAGPAATLGEFEAQIGVNPAPAKTP